MVECQNSVPFILIIFAHTRRIYTQRSNRTKLMILLRRNDVFRVLGPGRRITQKGHTIRFMWPEGTRRVYLYEK